MFVAGAGVEGISAGGANATGGGAPVCIPAGAATLGDTATSGLATLG